jgi:histidinol-phosphate aminotransferase
LHLDSTVYLIYVSFHSLGIAFAHPALIQILTNTKAPYNISSPTAHLALAALAPDAVEAMRTKIATLNTSRDYVLQFIATLFPLGLGTPIGASEANFVMVPVLNRATKAPDNERAQKVYRALAEENQVVVRFRGKEPGCKGCLRITIGSDKEIAILLKKLEAVLQAI